MGEVLVELSSLLLPGHVTSFDLLWIETSEQGLFRRVVGECWQVRVARSLSGLSLEGLSYDVEAIVVGMRQDIIGVFNLKGFSFLRSSGILLFLYVASSHFC